MNIYSFFSRDDLLTIKGKIADRAKFEMKHEHKGKENKFSILIGGDSIARDLADDIWHGNDYLVHFSFDYHGKAGIGGKGWAVDTFPMFVDWDAFKTYIDKQMQCYGGYETEEYGQMSMW